MKAASQSALCKLEASGSSSPNSKAENLEKQWFKSQSESQVLRTRSTDAQSRKEWMFQLKQSRVVLLPFVLCRP
jgi:hypothetical protein